jgi:hypothetical protein
MVGITLPRKLQTTGLFAYPPTPTIDDVMKVLKGSDDMESNGITRRERLKDVGLVGAEALLGSALTLADTRQEGGNAQGTGSKRPWYELGIIGEQIIDNQLLWYLSHTRQGMADIGECLDTAGRIDAADENI